MSVSVLTAFQIKNKNVDCQASIPNKDHKYAGWIVLDEQKEWMPLLNTEYIYDSPKEAIRAMEKFVETIRTMDFDSKHETDLVNAAF